MILRDNSGHVAEQLVPPVKAKGTENLLNSVIWRNCDVSDGRKSLDKFLIYGDDLVGPRTVQHDL